MNRVGCERLDDAAEAAKRCLEKMELREADEAFRTVLDRLTPLTPRGDQLRATSLTGLAEIHVRRCRSLDADVEEWLRGMFCAFALYKEALEVSEAKIAAGRSGGGGGAVRQSQKCAVVGDPDGRYFEETRSRCSGQLKMIEENVVAVLRQEIVRRCLKTKPGLYLKNKTVFDDAWLHQLTRYCTTGRRSTPQEDHRPSAEEAETENQERRAVRSVAEEKTTASSSYVPMFKRKIDFDRLQEGIKRIVSEVSTDVRSQYVHFTRHVPESLMQRRLFSELTLRLSPGTRENVDLLNVLEESVQYEDCSEMTCDVEVESRRSHVEEIRRGAARREVAAAAPSELNSVEELDETLDEEEEEKRRNEKDEDEDEDEEEEEQRQERGGGRYETIELRVNPSAMHNDRYPNGASGSVEGGRGITVAGSNNRSIVAATVVSRNNESLRRPSGLSLADSQSRKHNQSVRSEGGHSVGGLSAAFCMSGILTLWRSPRQNNNPAAAGANTNTNTNMFRTKELHNFEEVSPLTERDKVLRWLQSVEPEPRERATDEAECVRVATTAAGHPGGDRVGQAMGQAAMNVADTFRMEDRQSDAYEIYKYAMALFQKHPLSTGQAQMTADLLLRVGLVKCSMGQLATGSQLMEESVAMLERNVDPGSGERFRIAEVWFQVGNVFLADKLRQESLQARVMQLIRDEIETVEREEEETSAVDRDGSSENSNQSDSYCVCIYEAMTCYKKALAIVDSLEPNDNRRRQEAELLINVLSNMADCYVMTGNLDLAELAYEEALQLFPDTYGSPLLARNAHVLSMLGTVSFLLRNFVRAATMYETAYILLQHQQSLDDPTLEVCWTSTMLGLSYTSLRHYDKSIVWCIRAFTLYTRFFRGKILDVDSLSRWFIVQTLYVLGFAYTTIEISDKALYYLNLAKNMTTNSACDPQDVQQLVKVLRAIADVYSVLEEPDKALRYYEDALEQSKSLGDENTTTALRNQLLNRMAGANVDSRNYMEAGDNLEQALDYQKDVESSIKEDMIAILLKLGVTSTIACDLDKAIGCYTDCIQAYREETKRKTEAGDVAAVMASLGTLCHVKGCLEDDDDQVDAFMDRAEGYFEEAFQLTGSESPVCVQYANFLYQQGRNADALLVMLPYVFGRESTSAEEISYNGIEQAVLPDHLHYDADDEDTLVVEAGILAKFIAILCYNQLDLAAEADDALVLLYLAAARSSKAFSVIILGYGLMEMKLYEEAADAFMDAARLQPDGCKQTFANACICHMLSAYLTLSRTVEHLLEHAYRSLHKNSSGAIIKTGTHNRIAATTPVKRSTVKVASHTLEDIYHSHWVEQPDLPGEPQPSQTKTFQMSSAFVKQQEGSLRTPAGSDTRDPSLDDQLHRCVTSDDQSIASDDFRASSGGQAAGSEDEADREDDWEEWTTEEVIVETPREILELIANQVNRNRNLNGQLYRNQWTETTDRSSVTESTVTANHRLHRTDSTVSSDSYNRFIPPADSKTSPEALDNAAFVESEVNGPKPETREPEINGNLNRRNEEESSEEWVITEEVIETPAEILALLKRNCFCP